MATEKWSIETYCQRQRELLAAVHGNDDLTDWSHLPFESARKFMKVLGLSATHPFCTGDAPNPYDIAGIPRQGPLLMYDHWDNWMEKMSAVLFMAGPALAGMAELWLRLFAMALAPLGVAFLIQHVISSSFNKDSSSKQLKQLHSSLLSFVCIGTVASALILMTDTGYVNEFGPTFGISLFAASFMLALYTAHIHQLRRTIVGLCALLVLAIHLVYDYKTGEIVFGHADERYTNVTAGVYYDSSNPKIRSIIQAWPESQRTYDYAHGATIWQPSGDARTGLPFVMNKVKPLPKYTRVWLPVEDESGGEVIALDIAFPANGHSFEKPVVLVLHGLNGGSHEPFVIDLVHRRIADGSTVVVMIARGLQDLPIRGWNVFHGARVSDVAAAASALRKGLAKGQILGGLGYSMGAIVLNNYVARYGSECALDAAATVSGGLDMRPEADFYRAQRLWQPMLCATMRNDFVLGKWGERVRERLTRAQMKELMRARHVTGIDRTAVVAYNGFRDIDHYYGEMSALGDVTMEEYKNNSISANRRIHNMSIPLCVIHSLDDPLVTWRTVAANSGAMHPLNLVKTGKGNLVLLLTRAGGHVGWPVSFFPQNHGWKWMHDAGYGFIMAVHKAKS